MNSESLSARLILASSSKYRKMLLQRLMLPYECCSPEIDETPHPGESPADLVTRLAEDKAASVASEHTDALVIGSDQLAVFDGQVIGKPGNHRTAHEQLTSFSGQLVKFLTGVSVQCRASGFSEHYIDCTRVYFRNLQAAEIERYLQQEKPYDCAGSFKSEQSGIVLFERVCSEDPTALIGLPLIQTAAILRRAGLLLP